MRPRNAEDSKRVPGHRPENGGQQQRKYDHQSQLSPRCIHGRRRQQQKDRADSAAGFFHEKILVRQLKHVSRHQMADRRQIKQCAGSTRGNSLQSVDKFAIHCERQRQQNKKRNDRTAAERHVAQNQPEDQQSREVGQPGRIDPEGSGESQRCEDEQWRAELQRFHRQAMLRSVTPAAITQSHDRKKHHREELIVLSPPQMAKVRQQPWPETGHKQDDCQSQIELRPAFDLQLQYRNPLDKRHSFITFVGSTYVLNRRTGLFAEGRGFCRNNHSTLRFRRWAEIRIRQGMDGNAALSTAVGVISWSATETSEQRQSTSPQMENSNKTVPRPHRASVARS